MFAFLFFLYNKHDKKKVMKGYKREQSSGGLLMLVFFFLFIYFYLFIFLLFIYLFFIYFYLFIFLFLFLFILFFLGGGGGGGGCQLFPVDPLSIELNLVCSKDSKNDQRACFAFLSFSGPLYLKSSLVI